MQSTFRHLRRAAGALMLLGALPASAAVFTASSTSAFPGNLPANNDFPLIRDAVAGYGPALGAGGWSFGNLSIDQASNVTYEFLGFEAGFNNQFRLGNDVVFNNFGSVDPGTSMGLWMRTDQVSDSAVRAENGLLDFAFLVDEGRGGTVTNGAVGAAAPTAPSFLFKLFDGGQTAYILLDDSPGFDNHDDMVIRATIGGAAQPVSAPGSMALAGAGLLAVGVTARLRRGQPSERARWCSIRR